MPLFEFVASSRIPGLDFQNNSPHITGIGQLCAGESRGTIQYVGSASTV